MYCGIEKYIFLSPSGRNSDEVGEDCEEAGQSLSPGGEVGGSTVRLRLEVRLQLEVSLVRALAKLDVLSLSTHNLHSAQQNEYHGPCLSLSLYSVE